MPAAPRRAGWRRPMPAATSPNLLGRRDDDPKLAVLDKSCAAEAQEPTHLARGRAFFRLLQARYPAARRQHLHEIAGVGHDEAGMLTSACALAAIYDTRPCDSRRRTAPACNRGGPGANIRWGADDLAPTAPTGRSAMTLDPIAPARPRPAWRGPAWPRNLLLAGAVLAGAAAIGTAHAADPAHPVVVELFQSQGCSSCPPANANVLAIAGRPDVLVLSWQITYWDDLGWKDTFDNPAFTRRQQDYAQAFGRTEVFTPEVVVNGRSDVVGGDRAQLAALIRHEDRGDTGPAVAIAGDRVTVSGPSPARGQLVELVRYDPKIIQVPVERGENAGRMLPHRDVVREVETLGAWTGGVRVYPLPPAREPGLRTAILVRSGPGGVILAASTG